MRESDLLSLIAARSKDLPAAFGHVAVGPGDDCAVVRRADALVLLKIDQLVEGRHFLPFPRTPLDLIARKALARALSDVAAMGGTPSCALVGAVLPGLDPLRLDADALFDALSRWSRRWSCPIVGGDIATWRGAGALPGPTDADGPLVLSVTLVGNPHPARGPVLRSGARPGDAVYVTGAIGGALDRATGLGHHLTFEPRLPEAAWLCDTLGPRLTAMIDVSDGLGIDAGRLAAASGARVELDAGALPLRPGSAWRDALGDGEDYELLFTVAGEPPPAPACPATGTPVTRIGVVSRGSGCVARAPDGSVLDAAGLGFDHGSA